MDGIYRLLRRLWLLIRRERFNDDLAEEMAFHREQAETRLQAEGISPEAARHAAARQLGNAVRVKERSQEIVEFRFETTLHDLRFALRQLRHNPGFAATAIFVLALDWRYYGNLQCGNPILFKSLPFHILTGS